jgi:hypothetical protein
MRLHEWGTRGMGWILCMGHPPDTQISSIDDAATKVDGLHKTIAEFEIQAKAVMTIIREYQDAISKSTASAKESETDLTQMRELSQTDRDEISELKSEHSELVTEMTSLKEETSATVTRSLDSLAEFQASLEEKIGDATSEFSTKLQEELAGALAQNTEKVDDVVGDAELRLSKFLKIAQQAEDDRETNAEEQLKDSLAAFEVGAKDVREKSDKTIQNHEEETNTLIKRLKELEDQIDGAILRATGYTLFHSFQKRQDDLKKSSRVWAIALGVCAVLSVAAAITFLLYLPYFPSYGPAIYFKISLSLPFIAALTFCGWQYTIERRLEEEYAFKSNISISLKPYQELVDGLVNKDDPEERAKYTAFIIASINKVFTSPTGLVFDSESMPGDEAKSLLKATLEGAKDIIKAKSGV